MNDKEKLSNLLKWFVDKYKIRQQYMGLASGYIDKAEKDIAAMKDEDASNMVKEIQRIINQ